MSPLLRVCLTVAVLAVSSGPAGADTIANWPTTWGDGTTYQGGFGEPVPFVSPGTLPYMGQTFTAPDGTLDSLQVMFQARDPGISNVGDSVFHLLITEFSGTHDGQLFRPLTTCNGAPGVCFESADIVVPLAVANTDVLRTIDLGGLALNPGQEYFFVFDAWVTRDGVGSDIGIGTYHPLVNNAPGTARSNQVDSLDSGATRDGHFAEYWNNTVTGDIAYILSYTPTPVPEPATGALCALGLVALATARRRSS